MISRIPLLGAGLGVAALLICCSSSDGTSAPPAGIPMESGAASDEGGGGFDAATDGPPAAPPPDFKSGKRLRAQLLTADGVAMWTAWKDATLGVDCTFAIADDKKLRCIPSAETLDGVTFSDAACKNAVHLAPPGCAAPTIARTTPLACGAGSSVVRLGAAIVTTVVYQKTATTCDPMPVTGGAAVYPVTTPVAATELVAATTRQLTIGDGVATTVLDAEDGASQIIGLYDVARKAACTRGGGTKDDRCVPTDVAYEENLFSDMSCTSPAAFHPAYDDNCMGPPSAIVTSDVPGQCGAYEASYAESGANVTTMPLYRKSATTCYATPPLPDRASRYWSLGAALPQTSLPPLTNLDEGAGRIKLRADATASSARLDGRTFFDSDRHAPCIVAATSDGAERCTPLPSAETQPNAFSDSTCNKPIAYAEQGCSPPPVVMTFDDTPVACGSSRRRYFQVGVKITPAQLFTRNGASCKPAPMLPAGVDVYDAATELSPASFAALTRQTD